MGLALRRSLLPLAALALAAALLAAPAAARRAGGDLSPRLATLAEPGVRGESRAAQARALDLPARGAGSLLREDGRVLVEVRLGAGAGALSALRGAGAEIVHFDPELRTATALVAPAGLERVAGLAATEGVTEALTPLTRAGPACPAGEVVSEGDGQLGAAAARAAFGVDGAGTKVGILSDSFDRDSGAATDAAADVAAGDLPGAAGPCANKAAVGVLDDSVAGADEGRAMAQIVHDLAPGAALSFATAFSGEPAFAQRIEDLAAAGADVIADDVIYFEEPFFQDGPVAAAVNRVAGEGVAYFSAAGNENIRIGNKDVASWQGQFAGTGSCPAGVPHYASPDQFDCAAFDGASDNGFAITVRGHGSLLIDLQWAEPWYGVESDFDAYLVDAAGNELTGGEQDNPGVSEKPVELLSWENPKETSQTVRLAVKRYSGSASPQLKFVLLQNGGNDVLATEYPDSSAFATVGPAIFGHSGAAGAVSVGAVPYSGGSAPESYSSRGPVTHYFGPVEGTSPAAALPAAETLAKPDLVATDCGQTSFFASWVDPLWRFCGTSAAAPHAAAVAALLREADPSLTPAQVHAALTSTAVPVGSSGPSAVGAGLIDANAALAQVTEPLPPGEEEDGGEGEASEEGPPGEDEPGEGEEGGGTTPAGEGGAAPAPLAAQSSSAPNVYAPAAPVAPAAARSPIRTYFRQRPRRLVRTRHRRARVVFRFGSNRAGARFACRLDSGLVRPCRPRLARRLGAGRHVLRVWALAGDGEADRSPAVWRFRVKRR